MSAPAPASYLHSQNYCLNVARYEVTPVTAMAQVLVLACDFAIDEGILALALGEN